MSNLKKALCVLLHDQYDSSDLEIGDSDEMYTDHIIYALIESNCRESGNICPFKNYDCIGHCKENNISCAEGLYIDCNRDHEEIWKDFIGVEKE